MGSLPQLSIIKGPTRPLIPSTMDKIFEKVAASNGNIALIYENDDGTCTKYTYRQVDQITNKMAGVIAQDIIAKQPNSDGDYLVAVNLHPSDNLILTLIAIWKAGAAYLPLDHSFPQQRIDHILQEAKPVLVIYDEDSRDYGNTDCEFLEEILELGDDKSGERLDESERVHHLNDVAIVLYTSGTTGIPKGVRIPHKAILNRLRWQFKTFPYSRTERICVFKTALTFVDSVAEIWGPISKGLAILIIPRHVTRDPEKLVQMLDAYKVERLVLVPSLLRSMLMYLETKKNGSTSALKSLKLWICSGETLTHSLSQEFLRYFGENDNYRLCNFYGSTEIMADVTFYTMTNLQQIQNHDTIPIGTPVDNTILYLLDSDLRPVKAGDIGELYVSGLNLASGYVNKRDKDKFVENQLATDLLFAKLYKTGDFARLEKGVLLYEGRTDSQLKIRGHRVDLSEVERTVLGIAGVERAVVLCYKPGEMSQALLAFVKSSAVNGRMVEDQLKDELVAYMVPRVILIDNVPLLMDSGKVDRQRLLKIYENSNNVNIDYAGVADHQQHAAKVLFELVAAVLNGTARGVISAKANFYEIGGNSLNSIYTIIKLNQAGFDISIGDFLGAKDLGEILERMTSNTSVPSQLPVFTAELLRNEHKNIVADIISKSFCLKTDAEPCLMHDCIAEPAYTELIDALWEPLMEKSLSFIVKSESGKIVGASLNFDARDEPEVKIKSKLTVIFEFLEAIQGPVRDSQLPPGKGQILHSFMMGTHSTLTPKENVAVMQFMEDEVLRLATRRQFAGIFTTNTSPLTQQLGSDVYHYQTLLDYQVNQYVAKDGSRPFGLAEDSERAIVQWKPISH